MDKIKYRRSITIVFFIHIFMFIVSFTAALVGNSAAVLADSIDFIGDAAGYALSLYVLSKSTTLRVSVSITKAFSMIVFSIVVVLYAFIRLKEGVIPSYQIMSLSGSLGIISHMICVYYLYEFRNGDSNQTSVWICTINDLVSNVLTVIAAYFVMITNSLMPDFIVAIMIVAIALYGAFIILRKSIIELKYNDTKFN